MAYSESNEIVRLKMKKGIKLPKELEVLFTDEDKGVYRGFFGDDHILKDIPEYTLPFCPAETLEVVQSLLVDKKKLTKEYYLENQEDLELYFHSFNTAEKILKMMKPLGVIAVSVDLISSGSGSDDFGASFEFAGLTTENKVETKIHNSIDIIGDWDL